MKNALLFSLLLTAPLAAEVPPRPFEPIVAGPVRERAEPARDGAPTNDPFLLKQWWLFNEGQADESGQVGLAGADLGIFEALTQAPQVKPVILAIVDSGLDLTHEDIDPACLWTNPGEAGDKANNGIDDDGNGYVDDVHGWNFCKKNGDVQEDQYHGTHVGGLVAAVTGNGRGIAGAYPPVKIMIVKVFGLGGYLSSEDFARAVQYAVDNGAQVLSNSYGTPSYVAKFKEAIEYTERKGALFVCAAGNSRKNLDDPEDQDYPSCYGVANQLVVGASDNRDVSALFSNRGSVVDVAAPGQSMFSLMPGNKYRAFSGTSQACPLVAGAAALLWSGHPEWTYRDVKARLLASADQRTGLSRWVRTGARLNVLKAMRGQEGDRLPTYDFSTWVSKPWPLESQHPYHNNVDQQHVIAVPEAKALRIHFAKFDTDHTYDKLEIADGAGAHLETLEGLLGETWSVVVPGDTAKLHWTTSENVYGWGWIIDRVEYLPR